MSTITSDPERNTRLAPRRDTGGAQGVSVAAARWLAERAHRGQLDANGEPYIVHVGRVAAGVPLFARPVAWLHDVMERSTVDETMLIGAGVSSDQLLAVRLLSRDSAERSDDLYLNHVRAIALSPGAAGRIARAVKRADLLDHISHRPSRSAGWTPPYGAALVVLMTVNAGGPGADL